jgi:RNA polymerase sigma-70 factor (ECF subfamily)
VLVDLQDLSYSEAAEQLGVPIGTIMSRLHRGRRLLKGQLTPESECQAA